MEGKIWNKIVDLSCYLNIFPNFFLSNPVFHISFSKFQKKLFSVSFRTYCLIKVERILPFSQNKFKVCTIKNCFNWVKSNAVSRKKNWRRVRQVTKYLGLCLRLQSLNWNEMFDLYFFSVSIFIINFVININHKAWSNGVQF